MFNILSKKTPALFDINFESKDIAVTFLNPVSYLRARTTSHIYSKFSHILADGWLFVAALKCVGLKVRRYSFDMTSLAPSIFNKAIEQCQSVYFIGAKPEEIDKFIAIIKSHFPELNVVGFRHGYFVNNDERRAVINGLVNDTPDVIIVGMGVPLQEHFLVDLKQAGWKGAGFTCGGFMHQTTEQLHYYPVWINKFHLRMPYRLYKEPHFRKRVPDYLIFVFFFLLDYLKYRFINNAARM